MRNIVIWTSLGSCATLAFWTTMLLLFSPNFFQFLSATFWISMVGVWYLVFKKYEALEASEAELEVSKARAVEAKEEFQTMSAAWRTQIFEKDS